MWYTMQTASILAVVFGSLFAVWAAMFCSFVAFNIDLGRHYRPVSLAIVVTIAVGAGLLLLGLVALWRGQPYHVWAWPVYLGSSMVVMFGILFPTLRKRYRTHLKQLNKEPEAPGPEADPWGMDKETAGKGYEDNE